MIQPITQSEREAARRPSLLEVHGSLSTVVFAITETLKPLAVDVTAKWRNGVYLSIDIEVRSKFKQRVIDALSHGALAGPYDYRFGLSYSTMHEDPDDWVVVTAYPDMCYDDDRVKAARQRIAEAVPLAA